MSFDDIETADAATYARAFRALAAIFRHLLPDYAVGSKGDTRGVLARHFAPEESGTNVAPARVGGAAAAPARVHEELAVLAPRRAAEATPITANDAPQRLAPTTFRDTPADVARSA